MKMKLRFYQWFLVAVLSILAIVSVAFVIGFEYTVESEQGDYLMVGRPLYFEYTSTNDGVSWEIYFDHGHSRIERWEDSKQTFLFDER